MINGKLAQPSQVQNLFHSVQLNVNNPHFLIMQGRITKVLNMKPPEILSMLEEAAGTRMYENKKEAALKTLEKKQTKVDEINKLLDHEILPALEKLRKEKSQYMQWANGNAELDRLRRFCIAFEYVQAEKIRDNTVLGVGEMKAKLTNIDEETAKAQEEIQAIEKQIKALTRAKEASMGGEVKTLSEKVDSLSQEMTRESSKLNNKEDTLLGEKENAEKVRDRTKLFFVVRTVLDFYVFLTSITSYLVLQIVHNIEDLKKSVQERAAAVKKSEEGAADLKRRVQELSTTLEECEKEHQVVPLRNLSPFRAKQYQFVLC